MLIITIIMASYFSLPRLSVRMNRVFLHLLTVESLVIFTDVLSSWVDEYYSFFPLYMVYAVNILYFGLFFSRAFAFYVFNASVCKLYESLSPIKLQLGRIPFYASVAITLTCPISGLIFRIGEDGYHQGPLYDLLYVVGYFYLILSLFVQIKYRNRAGRKRQWLSLLICNLCVMLGLIIRRMFPTLLLMDTFCILSILTVYLTFLNPEFYLELRGRVFNGMAFRDYMDERNGHLYNSVLGIQIHNYVEMRDVYGGRHMDAGIELISGYLTRTFRDYNTFYYRNGRFILLGPKDMPFDSIMDKISERFKSPWIAEDLELYLDVNYATMEMGERVESSDHLLACLVTALEKADGRGSKDPVSVGESNLKDNEYEISVKRYLEKSLDEDIVEVFLQPIVSADTESVVGAEALCRIRDEEGQLIPPGTFIPIAEKNGRINLLGEQVFRKTCEFIMHNDLDKMGISWINVNLSPMQFMRADLSERYADILSEFDIDTKKIHLEITEASMVDDFFLRRQINALKEQGFDFALDDYGTGYSNLSRLKKCPFANVKLDMSIVRDFYNEPDEILPNMIKAFNHMNFSVTAEGIEGEDMARVMRHIGCSYLQGYYFSKPLPMEEFLKKYGTK